MLCFLHHIILHGEVVIYISGSTFYLTSAGKQLSFPFLLTTCFPLFSIVVVLVLFEELLHFFPVSSPSLQQMLLIFLFYLLFYFYTTLLLALPTDQNHNSTHTKCVHRTVWYLGGKITVYLSCMHNVFLQKKGKKFLKEFFVISHDRKSTRAGLVLEKD